MNIFQVAQSLTKKAKPTHNGVKRDRILSDIDRLRQSKRNLNLELSNLLKEKSKLDEAINSLQERVEEVTRDLNHKYQVLQTMDDIGADAAILKGQDVSYIKDKKPWEVQYADDGRVNLIPKHLRGRKKKEMSTKDELDVLDFLEK